MKPVASYDNFINSALLVKLLNLSSSHKKVVEDLYKRKYLKSKSYFFLKLLRLYHKDPDYKQAHGRYLLEDLVCWDFTKETNGLYCRPLILILLAFLSKVVPKFHRGLDLGHQDGRKHERLEDRLIKAF